MRSFEKCVFLGINFPDLFWSISNNLNYRNDIDGFY